MGEFLGVRTRVHDAVGVDEEPVFAEATVGALHQETGRDELHAGTRLHYLKGGAEHVSGGKPGVSEFICEFLSLGSFSGSRRSEKYDRCLHESDESLQV